MRTEIDTEINAKSDAEFGTAGHLSERERLPNGLTLRQSTDCFRLGQDSVLLAAFARPRRHAHVLDLGCGTVALSLLLYRPDLTITGLELQPEAAALFRQSIADNALPIIAVEGDLRQIRTLFSHGSMDYVICNPPYFAHTAGRSAATEPRRLARQDVTCTIEDVAVATSFVLHTGGKLAIVFRPERLWTLLLTLERVRLVPKRLRFVHQNASKPPSSVLVECRKGGSAEGLIVEPPLLVESEEYQRIYYPERAGHPDRDCLEQEYPDRARKENPDAE